MDTKQVAKCLDYISKRLEREIDANCRLDNVYIAAWDEFADDSSTETVSVAFHADFVNCRVWWCVENGNEDIVFDTREFESELDFLLWLGKIDKELLWTDFDRDSFYGAVGKMKKESEFEISLDVTLRKLFIIKATTEKEAREKVETMYHNGEIKIDMSDYSDYDVYCTD